MKEHALSWSFSHLNKILLNNHVKLAKQVELHKQNMTKGNDSRERTNKILRKPTWNNAQRVNKQNQFVPLAVQIRTGTNPFNTARHSVNRQTVLTSTALKVNTVKTMMSDVRSANVFHKTNSPIHRRFFKRTTVLKTNLSNQKVYTAKVKEVSTVGEKWVIAVKSSASCKWRIPGYNKNILSKYNGGSSLRNYSSFKDPLGRLKPKQAWGSRGNTAMPELHNKMELLRERTGPLLRSKAPSCKSHFYLTPLLKQLESAAMFLTWLEAIRIFLAFASYMGFIVYQMDVKSTFLYGNIDEEVYVSQPPGFQDPKYPEKVYKVVKAPYGLHQAPLSTFSLKNRYRRGTIDKTLFLRKDKHDIILVQVYVDDIIFGSTKKSWCDEKTIWYFIGQDKYVAEILKKFDFASVKTASTPIETQKPLVKDEEASDVDVHLYRSMIGSLMYVTASRPDIMFAVCACLVSSPPKTFILFSDYAGAILTGNHNRRLVNFLAGDSLLGNAYKATISKKIAQVVSAWIKSKNSLVKHFEDMRLCRPSKEYLQVWLVKDEEASDVDVHLYRSMIGSLMYVTASRPDIMFAVCACSRFQVTPKTSHLSAVKRIFRYLKGKPKLGLWYPRDSSFNLESYSDSDYAGAILTWKTHYLAMQKANHCGHFYNRSRICCCCKLLWANFIDSKSNVRLWVQLHEHKDLH
ncbi:putative ribonuclease H-like domain-containing protein [Tanacetum coccineum]